MHNCNHQLRPPPDPSSNSSCYRSIASLGRCDSGLVLTRQLPDRLTGEASIIAGVPFFELITRHDCGMRTCHLPRCTRPTEPSPICCLKDRSPNCTRYCAAADFRNVSLLALHVRPSPS